MTVDSFRLSAVLPVAPAVLFRAWIDGNEHTKFTGGKATSVAKKGGRHTAWDGYIEGTYLELVAGKRIVQSWRTSEFPDGAEDSLLELTLRAVPGGTELVLDHSNIPAGQGARYESGWVDHYFVPMRSYFEKHAKKAKVAKPAKSAKTSKPAKSVKAATKKAAPTSAKKAATSAKKPAAKAKR